MSIYQRINKIVQALRLQLSVRLRLFTHHKICFSYSQGPYPKLTVVFVLSLHYEKSNIGVKYNNLVVQIYKINHYNLRMLMASTTVLASSPSKVNLFTFSSIGCSKCVSGAFCFCWCVTQFFRSVSA